MNKQVAEAVVARSGMLCEYHGCGSKVFAKGLCNRHYKQMHRHGKFLSRTTYDPNEIIENEYSCEVILFDKSGNETGRALIDKEDAERIAKYKWHMNAYGYAWHKSKENIAMHRFILECPNNMEVDHINGNKLDNRKHNLRICNRQQNVRNISVRKDSTSGATGVRLHQKWGWQAYICENGRQKHIGWFKTRDEAIKARLNYANLYYGEFASKRSVTNG